MTGIANLSYGSVWSLQQSLKNLKPMLCEGANFVDVNGALVRKEVDRSDLQLKGGLTSNGDIFALTPGNRLGHLRAIRAASVAKTFYGRAPVLADGYGVDGPVRLAAGVANRNGGVRGAASSI